MLGLPLRIGFAHARAGQSIARVQLMKQPLALPHPQFELIPFAQELPQSLAVPEIDRKAGLRGRLANDCPHLFQLLGGEPGRAAAVVALG